MVKIGVYSDFHIEFRVLSLNDIIRMLPDELNICVIAGDISTYDLLEYSFEGFCKKYEHVVYVMGNHELWYHSFEGLRAKIANIQKRFPNLHFLDNTREIIKGIPFIGAGLFFKQTPDSILLKNVFGDFKFINNYAGTVYKENSKSVAFFNKNIQRGDIVVTHHLPSFKSVDRRYTNDRLNAFFVCDMERTIIDKQPAYWIHGHTHTNFDYMIGETRILANPLGYPTEFDNGFVEKMVLEIDG